MRIRQDQLELHPEGVSRAFVRYMLGHIEMHYPRALATVSADEMTELIELGVARARAYRIESGPEVARYIHLMLLLGIHFDDDPIYAELRAILEGPAHERPRVREAVAWAEQDLIRCQGPAWEEFEAALRRIQVQDAELLPERGERTLEEHCAERLRWLHPRHTEVVGPEAIEALVAMGIELGQERGYSEPEITSFLYGALLLGRAFDLDPQYRWMIGRESSPLQWLRRARAYLSNRTPGGG